MKSETRKRTELVAVRMTPDELAQVQALAAAHGLSVPDLMRKCVVIVEHGEQIAAAQR